MVCSRVGRLMLVVAFSCVIAGLTGCAPARSEVAGKITLKGQAPKMQGLEVVFTASDGSTKSAPIAEDGSYKATDVPTGEAKVSFGYLAPGLAANKDKRRMFKGTDKDKAPKAQVTAKNPIPKSLQEASTSNITTPVVAGKVNEFNYDIK